MIFATVATKTIRDRWKGWLIAAVVMGLMLWWVMSIYRQIDLSFYNGMPAIFRSLIQIPDHADVGSLAYAAIYCSSGALTPYTIMMMDAGIDRPRGPAPARDPLGLSSR